MYSIASMRSAGSFSSTLAKKVEAEALAFSLLQICASFDPETRILSFGTSER
jgi:hypothetical protein